MSAFIDNQDTFVQDAAPARECPHCGAHAQLIPVSTPKFALLADLHPRQVALGFACSACGEPRFGRTMVRSIGHDRIELSSSFVEVERAKERFPFAYLPDDVRRLFTEALTCYTADVHNAFASMCRRTVAASQYALGDLEQTQWRNAFEDIVRIADIDETTAATLEQVLFDRTPAIPEIDAGQAAVLIEIMKDILYQCHVRAAKFRAAMKMRRYFAEESRSKVTSIRRPRGTATQA
jgi:predicted RNA-binding Zn-ribbon protein involved in translation (DUF1610 family)